MTGLGSTSSSTRDPNVAGLLCCLTIFLPDIPQAKPLLFLSSQNQHLARNLWTLHAPLLLKAQYQTLPLRDLH